MVGNTILHYKILEKLGEGGMGVVYKAEDTKLKREVAIKFLPRIFSSDKEQLLEFEAQASAALNHQNIAHIYAIEKTENDMFMVMEYVNGIELKEKIESVPIPIDEAISITIQIAEGFEAAHKKGIVHRDIKSGNIMLTEDGKVKIMDFGLAMISGSVEETQIGTTVGTLAYMSPEQARGEEIDQKADIWSFGVVLYEMFTGEQPFKAEYDQALAYSIINETHSPLKAIRPEIPDKIASLIDKTLSKNPRERFQNFSEVLSFLKDSDSESETNKSNNEKSLRKLSRSKILIIFLAIIIGALAFWIIFQPGDDKNNRNESEIKRIAILPFTNLKNDPETNFLGFALADQIIGSLSYIQNILVRPSSTIRKYDKPGINTAEVGKELNVDYVLTGNYMKESGLVRLNLEMVDLRTTEIIWRNDFDVAYKNTFTLQDIVTKKVVSSLQVKFTNDEKHSDIPLDPLAYEYYLKAVSYPLTIEANRTAIDILNKAIELDSTYAPIYSELGYRYQLLSGYDLKSRNKIVLAQEAYLKALVLNKNLLTALTNLSAYYTEIGKTAKAVELTKRALDINPNNAQAHFWLGYIYRYTGLLQKSVVEMETALRLDPGNPRFRSIGTTYAYMKKYEDAIRGFELDKDNPISISWIGVIYFRMNNIEQAKVYLNKAMNLDPNGSAGVWAKALLEYINGNDESGLSLLKTLETSGTYDGEQFYNYANLYALYGKKEDCIRTLKKAIDAGFYCYPLLLNDIFLDSVRSDPEFQELLQLTKEKSNDFRKKISNMK